MAAATSKWEVRLHGLTVLFGVDELVLCYVVVPLCVLYAEEVVLCFVVYHVVLVGLVRFMRA